MDAKVTFAVAGFACLALTGLAAGSVEDRLAALEKRVAELEQRLGAAKGDEAVRWFKKAIADHGDCYYGDGACVGAYARLYLATIYAKQGKTSEAEKLKDEIRTRFPDAVTHKGRPMKDAL